MYQFLFGGVALLLAVIIVSSVLWGMGARTRGVRKWIQTANNSVMGPYRRGDYEQALQATEAWRLNGEVTSPYCYFRGSNLAHLGRLDEAEVWLRRSIEMRKSEKESRHVAISLTTLGHLMLRSGRYDEARECFEESIRLFPGRGSGYRSMAELLLLRGNAEDALRWANTGIKHEKADRTLSPELRGTNLAEQMATLAWATAAATQNRAEVSRLVADAVGSGGYASAPTGAQIHYHSGRALAEIGDVEGSSRHYEDAAKLDPKGNWGRAAMAALEGSRERSARG